jgi:hypothetical protein
MAVLVKVSFTNINFIVQAEVLYQDFKKEEHF